MQTSKEFFGSTPQKLHQDYLRLPYKACSYIHLHWGFPLQHHKDSIQGQSLEPSMGYGRGCLGTRQSTHHNLSTQGHRDNVPYSTQDRHHHGNLAPCTEMGLRLPRLVSTSSL